MWVWLGLVWARYFVPSLPSAAAAAAPCEAPGARAGPPPALAACQGPRSGPRRGLLGLRSQLPVRLGPPLGAGRQGSQPGRRGRSPRPARVPGLTARCRRSRPGLPSGRPNRRGRLCQLPLLVLREGFPRASRGDGGAGAGPAVVAVVLLGGAVGVRHHCYPVRHASSQACPLHYFLVHLWCAVGSAVQCFAGGRGGGEGGPAVAFTPCRRGPVAIHGHWGRSWVSQVAHTLRHSSQSGAGLRALGPRGSSGGAEGSCTRWTPVPAVISCVRTKVCTPSRAAGAGRGGGARALPHTGGWG